MQSKVPPRQTEQQSQGAQPKRGLGSWIRRGLVWLVAGLLALAVIGAIYQVVATQIDQRAYPPPGEMVNVNGHLMHINCVGRGSPTVILESGLGNMSADWANIQPEVAKTTRVCSYDRAGTGWSEPGPTPAILSRSPTNCTPCSARPASMAPTYWWGSPLVACTCGCMPICTRRRLRACSWWTHPTQTCGLACHRK